jgi:hypothetical protein
VAAAFPSKRARHASTPRSTGSWGWALHGCGWCRRRGRPLRRRDAGRRGKDVRRGQEHHGQVNDHRKQVTGTRLPSWPSSAGTEAFIATGITNARTEGINRLVKRQSACGFRNPANDQRRIRFHRTRKHRATTAASRSLPTQVIAHSSLRSSHETVRANKLCGVTAVRVRRRGSSTGARWPGRWPCRQHRGPCLAHQLSSVAGDRTAPRHGERDEHGGTCLQQRRVSAGLETRARWSSHTATSARRRSGTWWRHRRVAAADHTAWRLRAHSAVAHRVRIDGDPRATATAGSPVGRPGG